MNQHRCLNRTVNGNKIEWQNQPLLWLQKVILFTFTFKCYYKIQGVLRELKYLLSIGIIDVVESSEAIEIPHSTDILIKAITIVFIQATTPRVL